MTKTDWTNLACAISALALTANVWCTVQMHRTERRLKKQLGH